MMILNHLDSVSLNTRPGFRFFDTRLRHWVISADVSIEHCALIFKEHEIRKEYFSHYQFFLGLQVRTTDKLISILIHIQQFPTLHRLFYLETALHVSGGATTHHQELQRMYLQHLVFVTQLLLPVAIVEELAPPETCRAVSRYNKLCNVESCWIYIRIFLRCTDS